ncbi:MAG: hypothetical protein KME31_09530 [Tolypothrix carrinoi HA7290-LM1]|jgi:hypothetical protein|nr:hypothetical protein [Tolypothrix carrinoi HA7290-LM1]
MALAQSEIQPSQRVRYTGLFTNTTYNLSGNVVIEVVLERQNRISGYINFTNYPSVRTICGAGKFAGIRGGRNLLFDFVSSDPDPGCGFDRGLKFTVSATLSEDNRTLENGSYQINNSQAGVFTASSSTALVHPCNDDRINDNYNKNDSNYHYYSLTNGICSKTLKGCTREKVFQTMISQEQFIVPSPLDDKPVVHCREKTLTLGNPIRTTINSSDYSITNYTLPGHMFHPGKITRRVIETNDAIKVTTIGEGVGDYKKFNIWVAPDIWSRADILLSVRVRLILSNKNN